MVGNANIMDAPAPAGWVAPTPGKLAVAAAHAALNIIDKESLCERANQLGQRLKNTLIDAKESVPAIAAVRGLGSMIAAEFTIRKRASRQRRLHRNPATRAGAGAAPAELWRIRQCDSLPVSVTIPRRNSMRQ
ncbi:aminotransferase class III-fold pyridoxal phosphate-dependent enzyme [Escherichia coli]